MYKVIDEKKMTRSKGSIITSRDVINTYRCLGISCTEPLPSEDSKMCVSCAIRNKAIEKIDITDKRYSYRLK